MTRITLTLTLLLAFSLSFAQQDDAGGPGTLLSLEAHRELSIAQVDAEVSGRFANDGEPAPQATTAVQTYLISFSTTAQDGSETTGNAQLFVPDTPAEEALLAFAPGSTGMTSFCSPMQELLRSGSLDTYAATALAYAGQGLTTVLPDYLASLGPDGLQPYFVAMAEASVLIDSLRASHEALTELSADLTIRTNFLAGYSQGGHAVLAAADRLDSHAPDLDVGGIIGFGASGELDVLFEHFHYTAPWVIWAYQNTYPDAGLDPSEVLIPTYADRLEQDVRNHCILEAQNSYPVEPSAIYTDEFFAALTAGTIAQDFPAWAEVFTANATGTEAHGLPVLFLHGVDDPIVPIADQTRFVAHLCEQGSSVRFANYLRTRHETRYIGFSETLSWMRGLIQGGTPPSDCPEAQ